MAKKEAKEIAKYVLVYEGRVVRIHTGDPMILPKSVAEEVGKLNEKYKVVPASDALAEQYTAYIDTGKVHISSRMMEKEKVSRPTPREALRDAISEAKDCVRAQLQGRRRSLKEAGAYLKEANVFNRDLLKLKKALVNLNKGKAK